MEQTQLTPEQIEAIGKVMQAAADAVREWWEMVIEAVRKVAKILSEWLARIFTAYRRKQLYFKLRNFHIPHVFAYWIAKLMPRRILLMC